MGIWSAVSRRFEPDVALNMPRLCLAEPCFQLCAKDGPGELFAAIMGVALEVEVCASNSMLLRKPPLKYGVGYFSLTGRIRPLIMAAARLHDCTSPQLHCLGSLAMSYCGISCLRLSIVLSYGNAVTGDIVLFQDAALCYGYL